ncbi:hypothetical protein OSTOST_26125, partial [Ostertagia ostertagi]
MSVSHLRCHTTDPSDEITPHSSQSNSSAFTQIRQGTATPTTSTATTPRCEGSEHSSATVLEMDTNRLSQVDESHNNTTEGSTLSITNAELSKCLREGTDWPLDEASTSSAPATINRAMLQAMKNQKANGCKPRNIMENYAPVLCYDETAVTVIGYVDGIPAEMYGSPQNNKDEKTPYAMKNVQLR